MSGESRRQTKKSVHSNEQPQPRSITRNGKPLPSPDSDTLAHVQRVVDAFEQEKGELDWPGRRDPLEGLVETILSQNTNDKNRDLAYSALRKRYKSWREVAEAPFEEVANVVRPAGLNRQKAERIQALLQWLKENHGDYTADILEDYSFDQAVQELGHLKGLGLKTLAVVMCFDLGVDVFPVDTHVHRLCQRFGFVPESPDRNKTFWAMQTLVPEGKSYQFHLHLIHYGREICHARKPECEHCFIRQECAYFQAGFNRS